MDSVTINNIPVADLPPTWQARLHALPDALVTVRIEPAHATQAAVALDDDPAFGIWRDRSDLDIANYVQQLRGPRYPVGNLPKE
jgi:hypothetical protein